MAVIQYEYISGDDASEWCSTVEVFKQVAQHAPSSWGPADLLDALQAALVGSQLQSEDSADAAGVRGPLQWSDRERFNIEYASHV